MSDFSITQLKYIDWLAASKYERKPATEQLLAKELGVNDRTLRRWKQDPGFRRQVTQRAREFLGEDLPEIYGALRREAIKGSYNHIKLALEMTGEHTDKIKVVGWQDEIVALLKEGKVTAEEVMDDLGAELAQELFESAGLPYGGIREVPPASPTE